MIEKLFPREPLGALLCVALLASVASAQQPQERVLSGTVQTARGEVVAGVTVLARTAAGEERRAQTDAEGNFRLTVPATETVSVKFFGADIALTTRTFKPGDATESLRVQVALVVRQIHESVVIVSDARVRAAGLDVLDLGASRRLRPYLDLNFSLDNILGKRYFETQNFFESRLRPGPPARPRHARLPAHPRRRRHAPLLREVRTVFSFQFSVKTNCSAEKLRAAFGFQSGRGALLKTESRSQPSVKTRCSADN